MRVAAVEHGYLAGLEVLVGVSGGRYETGAHGTRLLCTGVRAPMLNGVLIPAGRPDAGEVEAFAETATGLGVPWSVQFHEDPGPDVIQVAARYGMTARHTGPLMVLRPEDVRPKGDRHDVRAVDGGDASAFAAAIAAGFESPPGLFDPVYPPAVLDDPAVNAYVVEVDGAIVAAGHGVTAEGYLGVYSIGTLPADRGRGYGRAIMDRIVRDGFAAGSRAAFLHSSTAGFPLYESMGFRTVATRTALTPEG
jgi:N-acetylglutamate synthase